MNTSDAASRWDVSIKTVRSYCKKHGRRIKANKAGGRWVIPDDAPPPITNGKLREFCRVYLEQRDNPSETFPWSRLDLYLNTLIASGLLVEKDTAKELSLSNVVMTEEGFRFAFAETHKRQNRYVTVEFSLISIGPSAVSINGVGI